MRLELLTSLVVSVVLSVGSSPAQEKKPAGKQESNKRVTVTADGVTYVVTKSAIAADGKKWALALEATNKGGDKKIMIESARVVTPEGKTIEVKLPMGRKAVDLPEDSKILLELNMGDLPKNVSSLARIELYGDRRVGIPGFRSEASKAFSGKKAEAIRPMVLKDVPVERAEK